MQEENYGAGGEQELTGAQQEYVEDLGIFFERFGLPRAVGRVLGVLLLRPREHSAEELANLLQASRGSISQATRALVEWGLIRRGSKPGQRRDYFSLQSGAWGQVLRREVEWLAVFRQMAERGMSLVNSDAPEDRRNLEEMRDLFVYLEREYPALLDRWEQSDTQEKET